MLLIEQHVLRVTAACTHEYAVSRGEILNAFTDGDHFARSLHAHDEGQGLTAVGAGPHAGFREIHAAGMYADQHVAGARFGDGKRLPAHPFRAAELPHDEALHGC